MSAPICILQDRGTAEDAVAALRESHQFYKVLPCPAGFAIVEDVEGADRDADHLRLRYAVGAPHDMRAPVSAFPKGRWS